MKQITDYETEGMKSDSDDRKIHGSDEETRKDILRGWMTKRDTHLGGGAPPSER